MVFADVDVGSYFEHEWSVWLRVPDEGPWNAKCGDRWGQFVDTDVVSASTYKPPSASSTKRSQS